jgi:hypothetical protein
VARESDYIVYVDESGDHGLDSIDREYPVFVLAFCIFQKEAYRLQASPALQGLKFRHFGHDMVVLHEREIRKASGPFGFLVDAERRTSFMEDLNRLIDDSHFTLVATVILKEKLRDQYAEPRNPYHIALGYGLERVHSFLKTQGQQDRTTHIVFEGRGRREDEELKVEFSRVCDGANYKGERLDLQMTVADKKTNCCGLQLADLVARPIGRKMLNTSQSNRAFDLVRKKFYGAGGRIQGLGLKVFP